MGFTEKSESDFSLGMETVSISHRGGLDYKSPLAMKKKNLRQGGIPTPIFAPTLPPVGHLT